MSVIVKVNLLLQKSVLVSSEKEIVEYATSFQGDLVACTMTSKWFGPCVFLRQIAKEKTTQIAMVKNSHGLN